jgi:hypothetical protein
MSFGLKLSSESTAKRAWPKAVEMGWLFAPTSCSTPILPATRLAASRRRPPTCAEAASAVSAETSSAVTQAETSWRSGDEILMAGSSTVDAGPEKGAVAAAYIRATVSVSVLGWPLARNGCAGQRSRAAICPPTASRLGLTRKISRYRSRNGQRRSIAGSAERVPQLASGGYRRRPRDNGLLHDGGDVADVRRYVQDEGRTRARRDAQRNYGAPARECCRGRKLFRVNDKTFHPRWLRAAVSIPQLAVSQ